MTAATTTARPARRQRWFDDVDPWAWAWLALFGVTALAVVTNDVGVFAPDTKPELYLNPDRLLARSLSAWQPDPQLGQVNYNTGILPVAAAMTVLQAVGLPPWLMQRLLMILLLVVGAIGAGRLVTELTDRRGGGEWLAGLVFTWHPWVVVGAATLPVRLPHALLPWLLIATHRAVTRRAWGPAAGAALAFGAMAGINGGVVNLGMVVPVLVLVAWHVATRQARLPSAVAALARIALFAVAISLYWLVPSLIASASSAGDVLLTTEDPAAIGRLSPPSEALRGLGMWTSYIIIDGQVENPEQLRLLTSAPVVSAGFALLVLAVGSLVGVGRRLRALVVALVLTGGSLMVGLNASGGTSLLGRGMALAFDAVPTLAAFRTTNKFGSVLVLGTALAIGAGLGSVRWRRLLDLPETGSVVAVTAVVAVAAGPLLPGQLHPLQVPVPEHWFAAATATDRSTDDRLLFLPGNAQTRYLWGHRGVDDLDTALFDDRHVVWRSTIPSGSAAATDLLTAFDVGLQTDRSSPEGIAATARLLGAGEAIARTDTDWLRGFGRPTSEVLDEVLAVPGARGVATFGGTASERGVAPEVVDPDDPALTDVALTDTSIRQAWRLDAPLLVVGGAEAIDGMARAGLAPADRALLYVDDLDDAGLRTALAAGGRLVLTDTNRRREWAISSLTDGHSPLLPAGAPVAAADLRTRTTEADDQTVAVEDPIEVTADDDPYTIVRRRAAGHPALAYDGNLQTGWQYGTFTDGRGGTIELRAPRPAVVEEVEVVVGQLGKAVTEIRVTTANRSALAPVVDGRARVPIADTTDTVAVTITDTFGFTTAPATIVEVLVDGDPDVWRPLAPTARLPRTLAERVVASPGLRPTLAAADLTILLERMAGDPTDPFDDEEARLRRRTTLPWPVTLDPSATSAVVRFLGRPEPGACTDLAVVVDADGTFHALRGRTPLSPTSGTRVPVTGCGPQLDLPPGPATVIAADLVTIDRLVLGTSPATAVDAIVPVRTPSSSSTSATLTLPGDGDAPVVVSSGQAHHDGWSATADGRDLGPPIVVGGYAAGWVVPAGTTRVDLAFAPQRLLAIAQLVSAGAAALALLVVVGARWRRRRGGGT